MLQRYSGNSLEGESVWNLRQIKHFIELGAWITKGIRIRVVTP